VLTLLQNKGSFFRKKFLKVNSKIMAKLLVKQVRSKINCPLDQRGLEALGLRKWVKL
jgi:hypothetical protein